MNKDSIHFQLSQVRAEASDVAIVTTQDFIDSYGNNESRKINGEELARANILAKVYNLAVSKENDNYTFVRAV